MTNKTIEYHDTKDIFVQELIKSDVAWNGKSYGAYPEGRAQPVVVKMKIPAHTQLPWHIHPMPSIAYVVSGHLVLEEKETGLTRTIMAGEAFNEAMGSVHRGCTEGEALEVIAVYAGVADQALSVLAAEEQTDG